MTVHGKPAEHIKYFFEIAGQAGIMYLEHYSFGGTAPWGKWDYEQTIGIAGHATTAYGEAVAGPVHIFPAWESLFHSPLCQIIREAWDGHLQHVHFTPDAPDKGKLPICSMGTYTPTSEGTFIKTTKYRFMDPVVVGFSPHKRFGYEAYMISYTKMASF